MARVKGELPPDSYTDYKFILRNKGEIARFRGRRVAEIARLEIGRLIADIYSRQHLPRGIEGLARPHRVLAFDVPFGERSGATIKEMERAGSYRT